MLRGDCRLSVRSHRTSIPPYCPLPLRSQVTCRVSCSLAYIEPLHADILLRLSKFPQMVRRGVSGSRHWVSDLRICLQMLRGRRMSATMVLAVILVVHSRTAAAQEPQASPVQPAFRYHAAWDLDIASSCEQYMLIW